MSLSLFAGILSCLLSIYITVLALTNQTTNMIFALIIAGVIFLGGIYVIWISIEMKRLENPNRRWHN